MKRLGIVVAIAMLVSASAWTEIQKSGMKHPHSGDEITIPGREEIQAEGHRSVPTLGTISTLAGDPRIMQLAVRFTF